MYKIQVDHWNFLKKLNRAYTHKMDREKDGMNGFQNEKFKFQFLFT